MTFSSDSSKIRDFRKCVSVEDGKWTSTHNVCIYTAQVYPFVRKGVLCAICIYAFWRRLLLLLILDIVGSLIPRRTRIAEVI